MKGTLSSNTYRKDTFNGDDIFCITVMQTCFTNKAHICAHLNTVLHITVYI